MKVKDIDNLNELSSLLLECSLPICDIKLGKDNIFFGSYENDVLRSCIGLELFDSTALLRSLAVSPKRRGLGLGRFLVKYVEEYCRSKHMHSIFLMTTTASTYFVSLGYHQVARDCVPGSIKGSSQYSSVCPKSAIIMSTRL